MKVALFCGGRGNTNLIKSLANCPFIELTLVVNAYDDGLSTGEIRRLVPGMLGPSDFRKNLSHLLLPASEGHINFSKLLEYRLNLTDSSRGTTFRSDTFSSKAEARKLITSDLGLQKLIKSLPSKQKKIILKLLERFLSEVELNSLPKKMLNFSEFNDFAFGNILLAGAYLSNEMNFTRANDFLCTLFDINSKIVNVSDENRFLIALTTKGELVESEAQIVSGEFKGKITEIFLLEKKLQGDQILTLKKLVSITEQKDYLRNLESIPKSNLAVQEIIQKSDVVIFGSGTQHSSLFPTYKVLAHDSIFPRIEATKIYISNLEEDLDVSGWSGLEHMRAFNNYWNNSDTKRKLIDYIVVDQNSKIVFDEFENGDTKVITSQIRNSRDSLKHNGDSLLSTILGTNPLFLQKDCEIRIYRQAKYEAGSNMEYQIEDFDYSEYSFKIDIRLDYDSNPSWAAVREFNLWIENPKRSRFLVIYSCEGETKLSQLLASIELMKRTNLAVLNGSRTQSRRQWLKATGNTYGEGGLRFNLSVFAAIAAVTLTMFRRKQLLTDPLSRCLILDRYALQVNGVSKLCYRGRTIPGLRTFILSKGIEVTEIPIYYKVFRGYRAFVNPTRDALRGFIEIMKIPK